MQVLHKGGTGVSGQSISRPSINRQSTDHLPYENPTERRTPKTATKNLSGGVRKGCLGYSSQRTP